MVAAAASVKDKEFQMGFRETSNCSLLDGGLRNDTIVCF